MKEIDRRYFEAVGDTTETKIKPGEKSKAELWRMIRDEVLFQHEYIANLPPKVKELIRFSIKGRDLTPADYDKLFAIAKKIEKMPAGQVSDYASKVTGTTTDLGVFEAALDKYIAETATRGLRGEEREKVHTKLIGLEAVYEKYRLWKTLVMSSSMSSAVGLSGGSPEAAGAGLATALQAEKVRQDLETQLQAHGFKGIDDFRVWIERYEKAFEQEAANIAKDVLAKFAGKLYRPVASHLKTALLLQLLRHTETDSVLIFTRTKHRAQRLGDQIERAGYPSTSLQGNLSQNQRQAAIRGFRDGSYRVLVATDIAARGIDVSRISHVINYDMPDTADAYTHRIGRTGRAEKTGDAFSLVTHEDEAMVRSIEHVLGTRLERRRLDGFDYQRPVPQERGKRGPGQQQAARGRSRATPRPRPRAFHTDFEKGFIRAEVISFDDFVALKGEQGAKEAGKMRLEGKDYVVRDGDVMHFRFNV